MEHEQWRQVEVVCQAALAREAGERTAFLAKACGGNERLRDQVDALLAREAEAEGFMEAPAWGAALRWMADDKSQPADASEMDHRLIGKTVSRYRILEKLGSGGMGVVYKAQDVKLPRVVALKFLPEALAEDPHALERIKREASAASALHHPNIRVIHDVEQWEKRPFIVMEYLEGQTLKDYLAGEAVETKALLDLAIQIAEALESAHASGIIHRDIKPANVFVTNRNQAKLFDFGLAKLSRRLSAAAERPSASEEEQLTDAGVVIGTVAYMSPEQARGEILDPRTDLFSFGAVLYEMATGRMAFSGATTAMIHDAILNRKPAHATQLRPELSPELAGIIDKALEKDRNIRYQSAAEIRADLQRFKRNCESGRTATSGSGMRAASVFAMPRIAACALLPVALIIAVLYFGSHHGTRLTDQDTIIVADFTNSTGDAVFDDALKTALSISLRQSPFLSMLSENTIAATLQLMARPANSRLTPDVAREVCQRAGSKAYIAGSIALLGSQYVLGLKAVNCESGDLLAQEQVTAADQEKVLGALGQEASRLRGKLGESLATVHRLESPLRDATTSSLEALKAYSLAHKVYREQGPAAALPHFQRAVQIDPGFAMGYLALGDIYTTLSEPGQAGDYYTKAFYLRDHASEREKLSISADYYLRVSGELDKAAKTRQEEIATYPRNVLGYLNLGDVYSAQGRHEKAAEVLGQALRLTPDDLIPYANLNVSLVALQRFAEARQIIGQAQARKLDAFPLHMTLYALAFLGADARAMAEQQRWFAGVPDYQGIGLALASDTEAYLGHLGRARELTKRAVRLAAGAGEKESGAILQENAALREAAFGAQREAIRAAADALTQAPASQGVRVEAALTFAMAGKAARARSLAQDLARQYPLDTHVQFLWLPAIHAQLALGSKNPSVALIDLQAASPIELGEIPFLNNPSCLYPVYVRGEAYLASGQAVAAASEFQKILDHNGIVWNCWTGALAHLGLARANALESMDTKGTDGGAARLKAITAYKDFLTLWKDADPDIPILKQAKAEYAKLPETAAASLTK